MEMERGVLFRVIGYYVLDHHYFPHHSLSFHIQKVGIDYDIDNWARWDDDGNFGEENYIDQDRVLPAYAELRMRQLTVKQNRLDQVRLEKNIQWELVITSIRKADTLMGPLQSSFRKSLAEITR